MTRKHRQAVVIAVTVVRVPLAAVAAGLLHVAGAGSAAAWAVVGLLLAVEITDMSDGILARRWGVVSRFGELLDPYCDSVSRLITYFGLAAGGLAPWWLLLVMALRDVSVSYIRIKCILDGRKVAARLSGKLKAIVQGTAASVLVLSLAVRPLAESEHVGLLRGAAVGLVAAVTCWSLLDYFVAAVRPRPAA